MKIESISKKNNENSIKNSKKENLKKEKRKIFNQNIKKMSGYDVFNLFVENIPNEAECSGGVQSTQECYNKKYYLIRELFNKVLRYFNSKLINIKNEKNNKKFDIVLKKVKILSGLEVLNIIKKIKKSIHGEVRWSGSFYECEIIDKLKYDIINFYKEIYPNLDVYWGV